MTQDTHQDHKDQSVKTMNTKNSSLCALMMVLCSLPLSAQSGGPVWIVGRSSYTTPSAAFKNANDGDTITIAAGTYKDVAVLKANNVTIVGIGGKPVIDAKDMIADGKGTWVIYGNNTTLDNFEMLNEDNGLRGDAAWNQAAVYLLGNTLTMRNMYIHNNMQGFFNQTNQGNKCDVRIENSIFDFNGDGGGHSHNLYVNHNITNLIMRGVWSRNCNGGHILKNRAYNSDVQGCMFTDPKGMSLNWFIDIPDGGNHTFVGNIVEHNNANTGSTMLAYGEDTPNPVPNSLLIAQNTFINDGKGAFIDKIQHVTPLIQENIFIGFNAPAIENNQIALKSEVENPSRYNYRIAQPRLGNVNYASYAYIDSAWYERRSDSVYGAYSSSNATEIKVGGTSDTPAKFALYQNYPDPFNPSTKIKFLLPTSSMTRVEVFNMVGQRISELLNRALNAGIHEVEFDGSGYSSGTYYYTITAGKFTETKKMALIK